MKTIRCNDFGFTCPFVARDETEEGVIEKITAHGQAVHKKEADKMMEGVSEEEVMYLMKSKISEE